MIDYGDYQKETEAAVIGPCLDDPATFARVLRAGATPAWFTGADNQTLWRVLRGRHDAGRLWTRAQINDDLAKSEEGKTALFAVSMGDGYAAGNRLSDLDLDLLRDAWQKRHMRNLVASLGAKVEAGETSEDLQAFLATELETMQYQGETSVRTLAQLETTARDTLASRVNLTAAVQTPWKPLNDALGGGLMPGNMYLLVGNTGGGKTQWALTVGWAAASNGKRVHYIAMEADETELYCRLVAIQKPGVKWSELYQKGTGAGLDGATTTFPFAATFPAPGEWTPDDLPKGKVDLVILDFLQLAGSDEREERTAVKKAAYACREYARKYQAVVVLLSSTSRTYYPLFQLRNEGKSLADPGAPLVKGGKPTIPAPMFLGTGKESGDIEHAATAIIALARGDWDREKDEPPTPVWVAVAKNRLGTVGWPLSLDFDGSRFTEPGTSTSDYHSIL